MGARRLSFMLALAVAGCAPPAGTLFKTTVAVPDGSYRMPVALGDQTGLVTAIEPAEGDSSGATAEVRVSPDPNDPNAVIVTWATGACDDDTAIAFQRLGDDFSLDVDVRKGFDLGCTAQLLFRGLRITFTEPVKAESISATSNSP